MWGKGPHLLGGLKCLLTFLLKDENLPGETHTPRELCALTEGRRASPSPPTAGG